MKTCIKCGKDKDISLYHKNRDSADGHRGTCKACSLVYNRTVRYGITEEQFNTMYREQDGHCFLCNIAEEDSIRGILMVDHCHKTGKIRALLCHACNTALGLFKDNPEVMLKAYNFLQR